MEIKYKSMQIYGLLAIIVALIAVCVASGISLVYGFAAGILVCVVFFKRHGFTVGKLFSIMYNGLAECSKLYVLILLIGATVSVWLASGVVPSMMFYGFEYMKGMNFLFVAFIIMAISAIFMGTAVGTVSTIGIAVLGIGTGFGIPCGILLGVIVSGAFIADKISPVSGLLNLTLSTTDTSYRKTLGRMLFTLAPTLLITGAVYYVLGLKYTGNVNAITITNYQSSVRDAFVISPWLLLLPVFIVGLSCIGFKTVYSIVTGLFCGAIVTIFVQRMQPFQLLKAILLGYKGNTSSPGLNKILVSGGMVSMLEVLAIVIGAIALSSLLEGTGVIGIVTNRIISGIKDRYGLICGTGIISGILTVVTCDQTMGIVLPARLLSRKYDELQVDRTVLARTISDTGTIIAPLMPWNVNALIIGIVAGMSSASAYAPYAVLCYIAPLATFMAALLQKRKENRP